MKTFSDGEINCCQWMSLTISLCIQIMITVGHQNCPDTVKPFSHLPDFFFCKITTVGCTLGKNCLHILPIFRTLYHLLFAHLAKYFAPMIKNFRSFCKKWTTRQHGDLNKERHVGQISVSIKKNVQNWPSFVGKKLGQHANNFATFCKQNDRKCKKTMILQANN